MIFFESDTLAYTRGNATQKTPILSRSVSFSGTLNFRCFLIGMASRPVAFSALGHAMM